MSEIEVLSLNLTDRPVHQVFYFAPGRKPKELPVLGVALARVTELVMFTPHVRHAVAPIFVLEGQVVIGTDYQMDPQIVIVPAGRGARGRTLRDYARRTS